MAKNHGQNHQTDLPVGFETLKSPTKQISCDRNAVRSGEAHWPSLVLGLRSRPGMLGNGHGIRPVTSLVTVCWLGRYDVQHRETMGKLYFNYIYHEKYIKQLFVCKLWTGCKWWNPDRWNIPTYGFIWVIYIHRYIRIYILYIIFFMIILYIIYDIYIYMWYI